MFKHLLSEDTLRTALIVVGVLVIVNRAPVISDFLGPIVYGKD